MNKRHPKNIFRLFLTLLCILSLSMPVWAAEEGGPGAGGGTEAEDASGQSRVITCGTGEVSQSKTASGQPEEDETETGTRGVSLGMFTTTGYCNCSRCSGGHSLTYSGTVPKAKHTISADLEVFPLGTKLMIGDVIYTVEDMGSSVNGNWLDIYYDNHEAAVTHGMKTEEVFTVES